MMSPPNFPIGPEGLLGSWTFSSLEPGTHRMEGFSVTATEIAHKGGTTYGYRISDGDSVGGLPARPLPHHLRTRSGRVGRLPARTWSTWSAGPTS